MWFPGRHRLDSRPYGPADSAAPPTPPWVPWLPCRAPHSNWCRHLAVANCQRSEQGQLANYPEKASTRRHRGPGRCHLLATRHLERKPICFCLLCGLRSTGSPGLSDASGIQADPIEGALTAAHEAAEPVSGILHLAARTR